MFSSKKEKACECKCEGCVKCSHKINTGKEDVPSFYEKTSDALLRNIAWISFIGGLLIIIFSHWDRLDSQAADVIEKIGFTILSSGVFAAILKSFQFVGIFKKEVENVMLEDRFIEKRTDLSELWKKVSQSIYRKKFPELNEPLQKIILSSYFPTDHKYYYESFVVTINIEELTDTNIIKFTQTHQIKVVLAKDVEEVEIKQGIKVLNAQNYEGGYERKIEYYKVDGVDIFKEMKKEKEEGVGETTDIMSTTVRDKKSFTIESKERREYSITEDNSKIFYVKCITKEMDVSISYPENMYVNFFDLGVVDSYQIRHSEHKNHITRVHRDSLILPYQGFGLTFAPKKK